MQENSSAFIPYLDFVGAQRAEEDALYDVSTK